MPRHFENIWVEAEKLSDGDLGATISKIKQELDNIDSPEDAESFGLVLFLLANISRQLNINVAAALQQAINNYKVDNLE